VTPLALAHRAHGSARSDALIPLLASRTAELSPAPAPAPRDFAISEFSGRRLLKSNGSNPLKSNGSNKDSGALNGLVLGLILPFSIQRKKRPKGRCTRGISVFLYSVLFYSLYSQSPRNRIPVRFRYSIRCFLSHSLSKVELVKNHFSRFRAPERAPSRDPRKGPAQGRGDDGLPARVGTRWA
jgi:hypothetical protein